VKKILVVDDEESMREMLGIMLRREGYDIVTAENRARAAEHLGRGGIDLVITDIKLPDGDGMEILRHVKAASPETAVVLITAFGSTQMAVVAMKLGAHDYLVKPFDVDELKMVVRNALEKQDLQEENRRLKEQLRSQHGLGRIIGVSSPMAAIFGLIRVVAPTSSTILISGESGTGKELVAQAVHTLSPRADAPFISINCGALTETLLESELFGHVKGAFTDAHQHKRGLFEAAHRGTLFLDEVGVTPVPMQVKLLRALQERKIRRVGGTDEIEVDVRVIAATNRPLDTLVREGLFREDLFYRLNVIPLVLPPLRERRQDIPLLAKHFLDRFTREMGKHVEKISVEAMTRLTEYDWPGNVRELENIIERAVALEPTPVVLPERLPQPIGTLGLGGGARSSGDAPAVLGDHFNLGDHVRDIETQFLHRALQQAGGDRAVAARLLGVTGRSLRYLIGKYGDKAAD
jgi:two-component system, NtrC family, response regulator PilR